MLWKEALCLIHQHLLYQREWEDDQCDGMASYVPSVVLWKLVHPAVAARQGRTHLTAMKVDESAEVIFVCCYQFCLHLNGHLVQQAK